MNIFYCIIELSTQIHDTFLERNFFRTQLMQKPQIYANKKNLDKLPSFHQISNYYSYL